MKSSVKILKISLKKTKLKLKIFYFCINMVLLIIHKFLLKSGVKQVNYEKIVTDGQIIFSRAAAAVYMGPYAKAALTKVTFSIKLQNLKI